MNKRDLVKLLSGLELHPSRKLGQNFLIDSNVSSAIVRLGELQPGDRVLEIGPGAGALTVPLLATGAALTAVEFDKRLADALRQRYANEPRFALVQADAVRLDYDELMGPEPGWQVVANLPYAASTPILAQLIAATNRPRRLIVMLQHEMAERLASAPGCKNYGAMSVRLQVLYDADIARRIPRSVFFPEPDVDSAILRLVLRPDAPSPAVLEMLDAIVRRGFLQRRKMLLRQLIGTATQEQLQAHFEALGIDPTARPETLSPASWLALAAALVAEQGT